MADEGEVVQLTALEIDDAAGRRSRLDDDAPSSGDDLPRKLRALGSLLTRRRSSGRVRPAWAASVVAAAALAASASLTSMRHSIELSTPTRPGRGDEDEPNPPPLPDAIRLFRPPRDEAEADALREALSEFSDPIITWEEFSNSSSKPEGYPDYTHTTELHFSSRRVALLFAPGTYRGIDFEVGYYSSVLGLGARPDDVEFVSCESGPNVPALDKFINRPPWGSGLDTFWRSIENVAVDARGGTRWVVSQAAPLRRMHVRGDLHLHEGDAWVSGGVAANVLVDGALNFGGQQQWLMRNVESGGGRRGGAWSLVFVGCGRETQLEDDGMTGGPSVSIEKNPRVRVEKPYIALEAEGGGPGDGGDRFELRVPRATFGRDYTSGIQFDDEQELVRDFRRVRLAVPSAASNPSVAAEENRVSLQGALDAGKDVVLSPGIYPLSGSLEVGRAGAVVLGLGYATLVAPTDGSPCLKILSGVPGVRVAGVMLEASEGVHSSSLLEWGSADVDDPGDPADPGALSDVFARVGGAHRDASVDVMVRLYSGNVYGDNLWLWRADHVRLMPGEQPNFPDISSKFRQTVGGECGARNGLLVGERATNITVVGLAVEHATEDQTVWNGDNGRVYFYQSEFPYDVDQTFGDEGFVGYRVGPRVKNHEAIGLGIYSNFRDHDVKVETAVTLPTKASNVRLTNVFTVKLDNQGEIQSVVNGKGPGPTDDTPRGQPLRCLDDKC